MRSRTSAIALVIGAGLAVAGPNAAAFAASTGPTQTSRSELDSAPPDEHIAGDGDDCTEDSPQAGLSFMMSGGKATVTVHRAGCTPERLFHVSSYTLDQSASNTSTSFGSSNPYSVPQSLHAHGADIHVLTGYVDDETSWHSSVALPPCGDYQQDLYEGTVLNTIGPDGHPGFRAGGISLQEECDPTPTSTPTPTPTPTPTVSASVAFTSAPSSTSTSTTTTSTTTTAEPMSTDTTTSAAATTTSPPRPTATPVQAAGASLARTGPGDTSLLAGSAAALLLLGAAAIVATLRSPRGSSR